MRILILGFTKIKYMPYMQLYLEQIDVKVDDIHLVYWSRDNKEDSDVPEGVTVHKFAEEMEDSLPLRRKIPYILKYRKFAMKVIDSIKPDFLIVLHSTTALTIIDLLTGNYKNRYLFDYRDLTYELKYKWYERVVKRIANNSVATFTSSDGFRAVLPENGRVFTSHNIIMNANEVHQKFSHREIKKKLPIRVAFWGLVRHYSINKQIIEKLGNDKRFELHYYGRAQGSMLTLLESSATKYPNVFFHGEYMPEERYKIALDNDIIHNIYDGIGTELYAMGNKYYDSIVFNMPQICMKGTYMGDRCAVKQVGYSCNPFDDSFADSIYEYYINLHQEDLYYFCDAELKEVMEQIKQNQIIIKRAIANARI